MDANYKRALALAFIISGLLITIPAQARNYVEMSLGGSFSRTNYDEGNYTWNRRIGASLGYFLFDLSQIEVAFQDVVDRTLLENYQDTTFHDRIFSFNWVQQFFGKSNYFQPYVKAGVGQLYRQASGNYYGGLASPASEVGSVTGVLGGGMKLYLTQTFAIKVDVTSYLTGGKIGSWRDNYSFTYGISYLF